jgi:hypothetical protein
MRAIPTAALLLAACTSSENVYAPVGASTWNDGYPAATLTVSPGSGPPAGTLEIASFGLIELVPDDAGPMLTLHVRIAAANAGERPWRLDLPAATVRAGASESRTLLANSDLATLPVAVVERGQPRTFDLYFAPPGGARDEDELAELDFRIPVVTADRTIPVQVHFTRREQLDLGALRGEPLRAAGWGSRWWANPQHAWPTYHRRPGILTPRPPAHAAVSRPPRGQRPSGAP